MIEKLSLAPAAAVTMRVEPERWTAAVRTVKEREAGVGSALPAWSTART